MTYTHLPTDEWVMIEAYYHQNIAVTIISNLLKRSRTTIYNVINFLKEGHTALEYYQPYKKTRSVADGVKFSCQRNISERESNYPTFKEEFGPIEGDTMVGSHHKSAIITLKPGGREGERYRECSEPMV